MNLLQREADRLFSIYIRQRGVSETGFTRCFVCGTPGHWKDFVCGHWQKRRKLGTRYHEINCQCICGECNREDKVGNDERFENKLRLIYGDGEVDDLIILGHRTVKMLSIDYERIIEQYKGAA